MSTYCERTGPHECGADFHVTAADDWTRVPGDAGDKDLDRAELLLIGGRWTQAEWHAARDAIATALSVERFRAEEKHRRLVEALEGLARGAEHTPFCGSAGRDRRYMLNQIRAVIEANR